MSDPKPIVEAQRLLREQQERRKLATSQVDLQRKRNQFISERLRKLVSEGMSQADDH